MYLEPVFPTAISIWPPCNKFCNTTVKAYILPKRGNAPKSFSDDFLREILYN
jgi:hypothetical protein